MIHFREVTAKYILYISVITLKIEFVIAAATMKRVGKFEGCKGPTIKSYRWSQNFNPSLVSRADRISRLSTVRDGMVNNNSLFPSIMSNTVGR